MSAFLITIDTEGDDLWSQPSEITTRNAAFLPRFQELCERYALRPTWLTNWEMAESWNFREFGRDCLARDSAEIGMHLHAWNQPPIDPLTADDFRRQPYLIEYSDALVRDKVRRLTDRLEELFDVKMRSHRAGRWALDERYAAALIAHGYKVDCSVTPGVDWSAAGGAPNGSGGTDYRRFPDDAYFVDPRDISRPGDSPLLEIPMTIVAEDRSTASAALRRGVAALPRGQRIADRLWPTRLWLRPDGRNRRSMLKILETAVQDGRDYVEFMLHSSELMPGGSPRFRSEARIERLYDDLHAVFETARNRFAGMTLSEYRRSVSPGRSVALREVSA